MTHIAFPTYIYFREEGRDCVISKYFITAIAQALIFQMVTGLRTGPDLWNSPAAQERLCRGVLGGG